MDLTNKNIPENNIQKFTFIFLPFACGYFLSYLYRSTNAVLAPYLSNDLNINAEQLGLITSAYFLKFGLFQLPLGVLLDKFGARKVQSILFLVAATGAILFSLGNDVWSLVIARVLIGLGVSGALMGAFKAFAVWYPKDRLPLLIGIFVSWRNGSNCSINSFRNGIANYRLERSLFLFRYSDNIHWRLNFFYSSREKRNSQSRKNITYYEGTKTYIYKLCILENWSLIWHCWRYRSCHIRAVGRTLAF